MNTKLNRTKMEYHFLNTLCTLTNYASQRPEVADLNRIRILGGPLKGHYYSMPQIEQIGCALGSFETSVVLRMQQHIKAGDIAYDIGANAGYLTMLMSQLVQDSGQVVSFEPDPLNFSALNQNLSDNAIENVSVKKMAISNSRGTAQFATFDCSFVGHIATNQTPPDAVLIDVETVTLDQLVYEEGLAKPNFIKIDVEGAEDKVILGASRTIQEARPIILAEVRAGVVHDNIADFLRENHYSVEYLGGEWSNTSSHLGDILFVPQTVTSTLS